LVLQNPLFISGLLAVAASAWTRALCHTGTEVKFMEKPDINRSVSQKYARVGHPSIDELVVEQGTQFPADPGELLGDFWPKRSPSRTS
jgi:hypothetical protein